MFAVVGKEKVKFTFHFYMQNTIEAKLEWRGWLSSDRREIVISWNNLFTFPWAHDFDLQLQRKTLYRALWTFKESFSESERRWNVFMFSNSSGDGRSNKSFFIFLRLATSSSPTWSWIWYFFRGVDWDWILWNFFNHNQLWIIWFSCEISFIYEKSIARVTIGNNGEIYMIKLSNLQHKTTLNSTGHPQAALRHRHPIQYAT